MLLLFLIHLQAQKMSQCFLAKGILSASYTVMTEKCFKIWKDDIIIEVRYDSILRTNNRS
jgi:hypothetical protein